MFIRLLTDHVTIGDRTYAAGDVVEVDKSRRKELVEQGHAVDHAGPATFAVVGDDDEDDEDSRATPSPSPAKARKRPTRSRAGE